MAKRPKLEHHHDHGHAHDHDHDHGHGQDHSHDHDQDAIAALTAEEQAALEPTVTIEDAGPSRKKLKIEYSADQIAAKLKDNFTSLRNDAAIPGFRRGRAPQRLLEKRFGGDVRKEVTSQLVGSGYQFAVEKHELRVLGEPEVKDADKITLPESGPLAVEVEVEVVPDFKLPELTGIEVDKPLIEIGEDRVTGEIDRYREMYGQFKAADAASHGDYLTADVEIKNEAGEVVGEQKAAQVFVAGESRNYKGVVAGIVVEDLGKTLDGKKAGDSVTLDVTGPAGHENEKLRGQKLKVELKITRIDHMEPLSLEQLTQMLGMPDEKEMRGQVKERLEAQAKSEQSQAMAAQVVEGLIKQIDLTLPEGLTARQAERVLQRRAMELMQRGATRQDIEQNLADLRAASQEQAHRELRTLFILDAVARQLDVDVSEAEVNGRIVQLAIQQNRRPERMREELARSGQLDQLFVQLREEKAVGKLLETAKVTEVSVEDFQKKHGGGEPAEGKKTKKSSSKKAEKPEEKAEKEAESKPKKPAKKKADE